MAKWPVGTAPAPHGGAWSTLQRRRESNSGMVRQDPAASSSVLGPTSSSSSDDEESAPVPAAAMAIPRFRSCRPHSASYDEISHRRTDRRRRTVSNNSVASTSSHSSLSSFGSSNTLDEFDEFTQFVAPRLPAAPYPVDPYHFYCRPPTPNADTTSLIQLIRQLLLECDIEHSLQPFKCKFKCVKYVQYSQVEFIVRVYTSGSGALLLEFQRRSGSLLLWDGLYSMLYHRLLQWVDRSAATCPQSGMQKKVAPREEDSLSVQVWQKLSTSVQTPTSGVEAMKIMVTSPFHDAQREGCSGLAVITEDAASSELVARYGIVEYLVLSAASNDLEMARCAIGALGSIARALSSFSDQKLAAHTLDQIKHAAHVVANRLGHSKDSLFSLELLRECARALGSFGKICPSEVRGCDGSSRLQHHVNHRDQQLSTLCREALRGLEANV